MNKLKIIKILNHNVVHCLDIIQDKEVMAFGKGIGFNKKTNDILETKLDKIYEIKEYKNAQNYSELVTSVEEEITTISEEIITELVKVFGKNYDEKLHVTLLDHLNFAVKRYRNDIIITNIFIDETNFMYPKEFEFAKQMLDKINSKLAIDLPQAEIGFIAMHIHSALNNENVGTTSMIVKIIGESLSIIEKETNINLIQNNLCKERLVLHLKFAIKRSNDKNELHNPLLEVIKDNYKETYQIALKIATHIDENYNIMLNESDISYLTVHIQNVISNGSLKNL